ncbi:hypothetical protein L1987_33140 [Smallanthus sonchifolius]|uniref:Uncharacterized protein n=1 Tax=Smallanthus sonchifolius TaxID=185202 RepID=A0ACB9HRL3_9ASTR|nr:hypothetical protein L1987_33140 [Smallanthus sonchifolius]
MKILPSGDRVIWEGVKPSGCTPREREWEETQVDCVLRHTHDIEGITYAHEAGQNSFKHSQISWVRLVTLVQALRKLNNREIPANEYRA